ncbi:MAG: ATP-binding protein [Gemmatimonadaceae bacterium]
MASIRGKRLTLAWLVVSAGATVLGALWLRTWSEPYLMAATGAIVLAVVAGLRMRTPAIWLLSLPIFAFFVLDAWRSQRDFQQISSEWAVHEAAAVRRGESLFRTAMVRDSAALQAAAGRALDIPLDDESRFTALQRVLPSTTQGEVAAVIFEGARPVAWAGRVRVSVDTVRAASGVLWSEFYTVSYSTATRGARRAVLMRTVAAEPPADRLARGLAAVVAEQAQLERIDLSPVAAEQFALSPAPGRNVLWVRAVPFGAGAARLRVEERARLRGGLALVAALLTLLAVAWRRPAPVWHRFATLGVGLVLVDLLPLNALSNRSTIFDASYFFTSLGGAFTASVGALLITSALVVLALFAMRHVRLRTPSRPLALAVVVLLASLGPFLLRDLARGIAPPTRGVPTTLWIAWEVSLFLSAVALLLAAAAAGRALLGRGRGVPAFVAPLLAVLAAILAPVLWTAPGSWPAWYPVPWIAAMWALALARRTRAHVLNAAVVAALGSVTLVWGAVARARVQLAERDVAGLTMPDPELQFLLGRFVSDLERQPAPRTRTDLLRLFVASDLSASGNPMELATWTVGSPRPDAELVVADFDRRPEGERELVDAVTALGKPIVRPVASAQGIQLVLGAPVDSNRVVTVVVSPRTRLIAENPFSALLGLEPPSIEEPPYRMVVASLSRDATLSASQHWERRGDELHGDWRLGGARGFVRAHVEVELRSLDALVQRGSLLVLLDMAILVALWTLATAADGSLWRWLRARVRRWRASYRARLTLALFGAFVVPAAAFATWTYRRLLDEDRLSRELLVSETLRAVAATSDLGRLGEESRRLDTPLFVYAGGRLARSSDELYDALLPLGRFLDPVATQSVALGDEISANRRLTIGGIPTLVGYRVLMDTRSERIVLAAPARRSELPLERQGRDLGVLVAFATALGGLAAFFLSGLAARGFERPIGALRDAALELAHGNRALLSLGPRPLYEFRPVYAAFRQMAHDLGVSRDALEAAQRRTTAVLRNVASGVVAADADGRVTLANRQAERILGATLAPGDSLDAIGVPTIHARMVAFARGTADDDGFDVDLRGRTLAVRLARLRRGGGGVVLTLEDVTELAHAQRVFAWGEMARQVAHEIKNPLTPIRLGVQHLRRARADGRDDFDEILERNVTRILSEIDRLDEIARSFSKFGTGPQQQAPLERTDVAAVVRDVMALERLGESGVQWALHDDAPEALALTRADELREVLLNVMENARHAGARHVLTRVERSGERVVVVVEDDGEGVSEDVLPRVFEPHFSTRTSGSGLGLAISKQMVDAWGGSIQLSPRRPRGTIVRLALVPAPSP